MFKDTNDEEGETSFSEAYRSQILNKDDIEEESSKNLIIISILVITVVALGLVGYSYVSNNSQEEPTKEIIKDKSTQELPVEQEESMEPPESTMLNNIDELTDETESDKSELEKTADSVKEELSKEEEKKTTKKRAEDTYLEQLAELSKEIDGEK